jgi:hypothetical protein
MYSFPMTANHEMAHQMGYASESECNFIGRFCKTIIYTSIFRLQHGFTALFKQFKPKTRLFFKQLLKTVHPGILKLQGKRAVLKQYTIIDKGFMLLRPILKVNQQKDGMEGTANL